MNRVYVLCLVLLLWLAGFLSSVTAGAANGADTLRIGYCNGRMTDNGSLGTEGKRWVEAAIYLPAEKLNGFAGSQMVGVRAALATKLNVDSITAFVREQPDGRNLAACDTLTAFSVPKMTRGWNVLPVRNPLPVDGTKGLYVVFAYHQKRLTKALSVVQPGGENTLYTHFDDVWQNAGDKGTLSVEALLTGDGLPAFDLDLLSAVAHYDAAGMHVTARVMNAGTKTVKGFSLAVNAGGLETVEHFDSTLVTGEIKNFTTVVPAPAGSSEDTAVGVEIRGIDGAADSNASNNAVTAGMQTRRMVLLEEFTTEQCVNCPRVAEEIHELINKDKYRDSVVVVCHHAGYGTDWLTQNADNDYLSFYNDNGSTYAPGVMFDRYPFFESTNSKHPTPVGLPWQSEMEAYIDYRLGIYSNLKMRLDASFDPATHRLTVTAGGTRAQVFGNTPARITLYLLEDSVKARYQKGTDNPDYHHSHVERYVSSSWGDEIVWHGNSFSASYNITLKDDWRTDRLYLAAIVGSYDATDVSNCVVENAARLPLKQIIGNADGIRQCYSGMKEHTSLFRINGMLAGNLHGHGLFVRKTVKADGTVETKTIIQ